MSLKLNQNKGTKIKLYCLYGNLDTIDNLTFSMAS